MNQWKRPSNKYLAIGVILLCISGCGLKKREPSSSQTPVTSAELPSGVSSTKNKRFLVRASVASLVSGQENIIGYNVVDDHLIPVNGSDISLEIAYKMPEMPGMGEFTSKASWSAPGTFAASYDISMGGLWEIRISLKKNGVLIDEAVYSYNVSE